VLFVAVASLGYTGAVAAHTTWGSRTMASGPTYNATFTETGLAAGTNWSVSVFGGPSWNRSVWESQTSSNASLVFALPNGSYHYRVHDVRGYETPGPSRGTFNVTGGAPPSVAVTFVKPATYTVTFTESGLPAGTNWTVQLRAFGPSAWGSGRGWNRLSGFSNTSTITFSLTNGSYSYHARAPGFRGTNSTRGTFNVSGASPPAIPVTFVSRHASGTTYAVTFEESGLPSGTNWTVAVSAIGGWGWHHGHRHSVQTTPNSSLSFSLANGSYRYVVFGVPGYEIANNGTYGSFTVNGSSPATIDIVFVRLVNYTVTFTETGLPSGTNWSVVVIPALSWGGAGGLSQFVTSNTSTITFSLPNGSYFFHVSHVRGYHATNNSSGIVNVTGASPPAINVTFAVHSHAFGVGAWSRPSTDDGVAARAAA